jgi:hypothetical protein
VLSVAKKKFPRVELIWLQIPHWHKECGLCHKRWDYRGPALADRYFGRPIAHRLGDVRGKVGG